MAASSSSGGLEAAVAARPVDCGAAVAASAEALARLRVSQPFRLNSIALKWIRDSHENPPRFPTTDCVDLTDRDPYHIGVLDGNRKGMEYKFQSDERTPWSWRQMLAALSPKVKESVLGSEPVLGVVRITCQPELGSYDHK